MHALTAYLTHLVAGLRAAVANHTARVAPARLPVFILAWHYLGRAGQRLQRLLALWQQGRVPAPAKPRPGRPATPRSAPRLPARRAWVVAQVGYTAAAATSNLQHLCTTPEMQEFLAACPQAARILRPIWRMNSPDPFPHPLALPPRPQRPKREPKPRQPRPKPEPFRRPLQAYVRAAARAWKRPHERTRKNSTPA